MKQVTKGYPGRVFSLVDRAALNAFVLAGHTVSRFLKLEHFTV